MTRTLGEFQAVARKRYLSTESLKVLTEELDIFRDRLAYGRILD